MTDPLKYVKSDLKYRFRNHLSMQLCDALLNLKPGKSLKVTAEQFPHAQRFVYTYNKESNYAARWTAHAKTLKIERVG